MRHKATDTSFQPHYRSCFEREFVPPHDPNDRVVVQRVSAGEIPSARNTWEVRIFDPCGPFHVYFVGRGLLHLQFWNAFHRISILTPSRLTCHSYEAFPVAGWKFVTHSYEKLCRAIEEQDGISVPSSDLMDQLCVSYVANAEQLATKSLSAQEIH